MARRRHKTSKIRRFPFHFGPFFGSILRQFFGPKNSHWIATLDLIEDLLRDHLEGLLDVLARLGGGLCEADAVVLGKVPRLLRRHLAVVLREGFTEYFCQGC